MSLTDPCSKLVGISVANDAASYTGTQYGVNVPQSTGTVNCGPYGFWDPALTTVVSGAIPQNSSNVTTLAPGLKYCMAKEVDVPWQYRLQGVTPYQGTSGSGTQVKVCPTGYTTNPWTTGLDTAVENLGAPLANPGAAISEGSQVGFHEVNANNVPGVIGVSNFTTQQGGLIDNMAIINSQWCVVISKPSTSSGSSSNWGVQRTSCTLTNAPGFPVMTGISLSSGGTGYTSDFPLIVSGCTIAPTLFAQTSAGAVTGKVYASGTNLGINAYGDCPAGATVSFANGAGTGAAGTPIVQTLTTNPGIFFSGSGGSAWQNNVVGGALAIPPPACYQLDATIGDFPDDYCESAMDGINLGTGESGSVQSAVIRNFVMVGASNTAYSMIRTNTSPKNNSFGITGATCTGCLMLLNNPDKNGGNVISASMNNGAGNNAAISGIFRHSMGYYLSNDPAIATNVNIGISAPNCGSGCTTAEAPVSGFLCKMVGGDLQRMTAGDASEVAGACSNGSFSTAYDVIHGGTAVDHGIVSLYFQAGETITKGDYVVCGGSATPCLAHDTGSTTAPSGTAVAGTVADSINGDLQALPSTPSISGITSVVTGASTVTDTYGFAAVPDDPNARTTSAGSSVFTVSNGPQSLTGSSKIAFSGIPNSPNNIAVYRLSIGHAISSMTLTVGCGPDGTATFVTPPATSSGWTASIPPTVAFSGGGFSTEPSGTVQVDGGQITGVSFANGSRGAGCTGSGTATLTANPQEVGLIGLTSKTTTFTDHGQPAIPGTTVPGAAVTLNTTWPGTAELAANVNMKPELYYGPFASTSSAANRVPDTGFKQSAPAYWALPAGVAIASNGDTNSNSGASGLQYIGTGSPSGILQAYAGPIMLVSGQSYSFSMYADRLNVTTGSILIRLCNTPTCGSTQYAALGPLANGVAKTESIVFTSSATIAAYFVVQFNLTAPSGQQVSVAEPMVAQSTTVLSYIPNDGPGQADITSGYKSAITATLPSITPQILYSAAGTVLPTCNTAAKGLQATVSDATSPTYMATYTSGGAVTAAVLCSGTTWVTH